MNTYTYTLMDVSNETYSEIKEKLEDAGHKEAIDADGILNMRGVGLRRISKQPNEVLDETHREAMDMFFDFVRVSALLAGFEVDEERMDAARKYAYYASSSIFNIVVFEAAEAKVVFDGESFRISTYS